MNDQNPQPDIFYKIRNSARVTAALYAGMQLELFTPLKDGPLTTEQLATKLGVYAHKLGPLLYSLVANGLLIEDDGKFTNTPETAAFLVKGNDKYIGDSHKIWLNNLLAALETAETIKTGIPQAKYDWRNMDKEKLRELMEGMAASDLTFAHWLSKTFDFSNCRNLLDAACGSGTFAISMTQIHPQLSATVVDLPEVTPITIETVEKAGASDRVQVVSADLTCDPIPGKYDSAILNSITQTISQEEARSVINNVGKVVNPGGWLYIFGSGMLEDSRLSPQAAVDINLVLINVYDYGQSITESEYREWLEEAGFENLTFNYDDLAITAQKKMEDL